MDSATVYVLLGGYLYIGICLLTFGWTEHNPTIKWIYFGSAGAWAGLGMFLALQ